MLISVVIFFDFLISWSISNEFDKVDFITVQVRRSFIRIKTVETCKILGRSGKWLAKGNLGS